MENTSNNTVNSAEFASAKREPFMHADNQNEITSKLTDLPVREENQIAAKVFAATSARKVISILLEGESDYITVHPYLIYGLFPDELFLLCYGVDETGRVSQDSGYRDFDLYAINEMVETGEEFECRDDFDVENRDLHPDCDPDFHEIVAACQPNWINSEDICYFHEDGMPICELRPRKIDEMADAESRLRDIVWYNRCYLRNKYAIEDGSMKIINSKQASWAYGQTEVMVDTIWQGACRSAARIEAEIPMDELLIEDEFEWGMINGKLSALRWALGWEWDFLDT